jgi:choline kinase
LALNDHPLGEEEIKVVVDADGKMIEINKTCDPKSAIGESIGIEKMSVAYQTALFVELDKMILEEGLDNVFYEKAFERLIAQGHTFNIVDVTNLFSMELDTVEDFENAVNTIPCELA